MRVIIVGGVAGGASTAARLRRLDEQAEIVIYERGEHVSFANCGLPYHVGGVIEDREALLLHTPQSLHDRYAIDVFTRTEVQRIDPEGKTVRVRDLRTGESRDDHYDFLVLSPGAKPIAPPIPGIEHPKVMTLRNMADMDRLRGAADAGAKRAVVVGGGYIGIEMAENLVARGVQVTLVEMAKQVLTFLDPEMAELAHEGMRERGVALRLGDSVVELRDGESKGESVEVALASGAVLPADLVVLAIGVTPENTLARDAGLQIGPSSGIVVDERMRTSAPSVFAVGDAVEVTHFVTKSKARIPLAGPANRQGRIAANNICGIPSKYEETQGTSIIQVFDLVCAATGASAALLRSSGIEAHTVRVHGKSHAGYYPGAETVHLILHYAPSDGRLLGAQGCGLDGIDKRIDVLAVAIRHGATVYDLEDYELSYAPPFGSAKDPVNMLGFAAANALRGGDVVADPTTLDAEVAQGAFLLDVRGESEARERGRIEGGVLIPLNELRGRLSELPKDRTILIYCATGVRGYYAQRILAQRGFEAKSVSGGYESYRLVRAAQRAS